MFWQEWFRKAETRKPVSFYKPGVLLGGGEREMKTAQKAYKVSKSEYK